MTDKNLVAARLYIGNLAHTVDEEILRKKFGQFGEIKMISKIENKGIAFIQYADEDSAFKAISDLNQTQLEGKKINVALAKKDNKVAAADGEGVRSFGRGGGAGGAHRGGGRPYDDGYRGGGGGQRWDNQYDAPDHMGGRGGHGAHGGNGGHSYNGQGGGNPSTGPAEKPEQVNDVEIICMAKHTRDWAETIEARLKNMGLTVDVLFPNPEIPIGKVLGNIAMRGVMFGVCVSPENEIHRSLTVNVLQGEQLEHRNMPFDEAVTFIGRNFSDMLSKPAPSKSAPSAVTSVHSTATTQSSLPTAGGLSASQRPGFGQGLPNDIRTIVGFLVESRPMSIMEYDKLIKHLVAKREATLKEEYGTSIPAHLLVPPVGPNQDPVKKAKQEEVQNKVIEIINDKRNLLFPLALPTKSTAEPALDPKLQQAIDSLVQSGPNLLSSLTKATTTTTTNSSNGGSSAVTEREGHLSGYYTNLFSGGNSGGAGGCTPTASDGTGGSALLRGYAAM